MADADEPTLPSQEHSYSGVYSELCNDVVEGDVGEYILDEPTLPSQEQRNGFAAQLVAVPRHFRALYDTVHDLSHLRNEMAKLRGNDHDLDADDMQTSARHCTAMPPNDNVHSVLSSSLSCLSSSPPWDPGPPPMWQPKVPHDRTSILSTPFSSLANDADYRPPLPQQTPMHLRILSYQLVGGSGDDWPMYGHYEDPILLTSPTFVHLGFVIRQRR